jgi:nitrogen regulatory protein PII
MKLIRATLPPHKLDAAHQALQGVGVQGMTVTEVRQFTHHAGHTEFYRGAELRVEFEAQSQLEVAVEDALRERVVEALQVAVPAQLALLVLPVDEAVRVRTGERGTHAL